MAAALGFAISTGSQLGLGLSILAPVVFLRQNSRSAAFFCAAVYHLFALRELPLVSRNFFGPTSGLAEGISLWLVTAALLSLPWLWAWSPSPITALWRCPLALLLSVVPPLGIIGLASPVAAAGLLFPGGDFAGLALTLVVPALLINSEAALVVIASLVVFFRLLAPAAPLPPNGWTAVNTHFGQVAHGHADLLREYQIATQIETETSRSRARIVIFPEAVAPSWIGSVIPIGKTVVVGTVEPICRETNFQAELAALRDSTGIVKPVEAERDENKALVRGAQTAEFKQRIPIAIGMWKPLTGEGVPLNLGGRGTISVDGQRAAIIICYEQLIAWPVLSSFSEHPTVLLALANNVWVSGTAIPQVERTAMQSWAALFNVPLLSASND